MTALDSYSFGLLTRLRPATWDGQTMSRFAKSFQILDRKSQMGLTDLGRGLSNRCRSSRREAAASGPRSAGQRGHHARRNRLRGARRTIDSGDFFVTASLVIGHWSFANDP